MFNNLNFYELLNLEGLDPALTRNENYQKLTTANSYWNRRYGSQADLMKALISEAMLVFKDDISYGKFRESYISGNLDNFINGAIHHNKKTKVNELTSIKFDQAVKIGDKIGVSESEISSFIKNKGIKTVKKIDGKNWILHFIVSSGIGLILLIFIIAKPLILQNSVLSQTQIENAIQPSSLDKIQAINYINKKAPLYLEVKKAANFLKNFDNDEEAKSALIKATNVFIKWGDEAANDEEAKELYEEALKCDQGELRQEIENKINRLNEKNSY